MINQQLSLLSSDNQITVQQYNIIGKVILNLRMNDH